MPRSAAVFKILVAGPGDVKPHRTAIIHAINDWTRRHSDHLGISMIPVDWEQVRPDLSSDAQDVINKRIGVDRDAVIAVFGQRIGRATPRAISGTVEEIQEAIAESKHVMVYFSDGPISRDGLNIEQLAGLEYFRDSLKSQGLLGFYKSLPDLKRKIDDHVSQLGYDFKRLIEDRESAIAPEHGSIRTRLGQGTLQVLSVAVSKAVESDSDLVSINRSSEPDLSHMSEAKFREMLGELSRLGQLTTKIDQGDAGIHVEISRAGFEKGLPAIIKHFDQVENRVKSAICSKSPTTAEELSEEFDVPVLVVRHIARGYADEGLLSVNRYSDITKISKPTSALCGWEDIRRRKACVVIGTYFPNSGDTHRQTFEIDLLNEGEHEAREIKAVFDVGDGFPEEPMDSMPFVIPPMTSGPESRFHIGFAVPWPERNDNGEPKPNQEKIVRIKVTFRNGQDERDDALFTLLLRNAPDPKRWTAEELRDKARLTPICQGSRMESR